ncbi:MAG: Hsp33 family molecular chaperone HslO [Peptoniphilaceae bacterium]
MDYIVRAVDKDGFVKITGALTTDIVENARKTHGLSKTASAALGRTLTAGVMMTDSLKNEQDSITINIKGDGDLGRIVVTGKNNGKIKGYVNNPLADAEIREVDNKLDVAKIVGKGTLTIVTDLGLKEPYTGQVPLISGEIAEDIANYFYTSDQVPSVVSLGVLVDLDYTIKSAGGFILQLMPGADENIISKIEENLKSLKSITNLLEEGKTIENIIEIVLNGFEVKYLNKREISYECDCSRDKVTESLISLGRKELENIIEEDGEAEVKCYFCNKDYNFNKDELKNILKKIEENN